MKRGKFIKKRRKT